MAMYDAGGGYRLRPLRSANGVPEGEMDALLLGKTRVRITVIHSASLPLLYLIHEILRMSNSMHGTWKITLGDQSNIKHRESLT